jgi:peptidoglycan/xylan/chitin deacetylase (PgdA/CDA1 family)
MYHYVRDLGTSRFPRIKGMELSAFRAQLCALKQRYEMASLESALAFLGGAYQPHRDLCLLTFDDGLKEHYRDVTPLLAQHGIQGLFFIITSALENRRVAPVHMNHFLMAALDLSEYRDAFIETCAQLGFRLGGAAANTAAAARTYPWDTADVASFKYFLNFELQPKLRDRVIEALFERYIDQQRTFAAQLYVTWREAREMQSAGMMIGGHTHRHQPLSSLRGQSLADDLSTCRGLLDAKLAAQPAWPFSYPYGKQDSYSAEAVEHLRALGFDCSFTTETGGNAPGTDLFALRRFDCKQIPWA